jgi:ABC-type transport system substrate-binding protein
VRYLLSLLMIAGLLMAIPRTPDGAGRAAAAYAGSIAIADGQFPDSTPLGGAYTPTSANRELAGALTAGLLGYSPQLSYFPDLAAVVPSSANGGISLVGGNEVLTIHRKPGQRWSDGSPITGADYLVGLLLDRTPEVDRAFGIDKISTISLSGDDLTISYTGVYAAALAYGLPSPLPLAYLERKYGVALPASLLSGYDADAFTAYLQSGAYQGSALQQLARAWLADRYTAPGDVFAGPYRIAAWMPGQQVILTPNPFYAALPPDPNHPRPARIQFVAVGDGADTLAQQMVTATTYNSIDEAVGFDPGDLAQLQRSSYHIVTQDAVGAVRLVLNLSSRPLRDIRVRQALLYAIDKRAFLQALFPGADRTALDALSLSAPIPSASPWSDNGALPRNPYYPLKARTLLADAGFATAFGGPGTHLTLSLYTTTAPTERRSAQVLQAFWSQIGVSAQIHYAPPSGPNGMFSSYGNGGILARRHFDVVLVSLSQSPDPDGDLRAFDPSGIPDADHPGGENFGDVQDPQIVDYLERARATADDRERAAIYDDFQIYLYRQAYWIMLYNTQNIVVVKGTIGNFQPNPQGNEWNAWQWWDKKIS